MPYIKDSFAGLKAPKPTQDDKDNALSYIPNSGAAYTGGTGQAQSYNQPSGAGAGDLGGGDGRFINFSRYLSQNQAGANGMANSLGDAAQAKGQAAGKAINDQNRAFQTAANAGTVQWGGERAMSATPDANVSQNVAGSSNLQTKKQGLQQQDVGTISRGEMAAKAAQTYSGPKSLTDLSGFGDVTKQVGAANTAINGLQSFEGTQGQLQDQYGKQGSYTEGDSLLDAGLAGNAGAGRFKALQQKFGGLSNSLNAAQQNATNYANKANVTSQQNASVYDSMGKAYDEAQAKATADAQAKANAQSAQASNNTATDLRNQNISQNTDVVQIDAARQADLDGLTTAWENAGSPLPYDEWKASYKAGKH